VSFSQVASSANTTMLQVAVVGLVLPTLMTAVGQFEAHAAPSLAMSRFISIVFLLLYVAFMVHTMCPDWPAKDKGKAVPTSLEQAEEATARGAPVADTAAAAEEVDADDDKEEEEILLDMPSAIVWLLGATVMLAYLSELLSGAVEGAAEAMGLTPAFVGFVIIPIIGNAAEHSTAVVMAYKLKMDLALTVAQGSSTQIALFVIPTMVLLGWAIGQPLDLSFGVFETVVTWLATVIVTSVINDGSTNWLEGTMLVATYVIISAAFFFYN